MGLATGSQDWVVALKQAEHTLVPKAPDVGGMEAVGGKGKAAVGRFASSLTPGFPACPQILPALSCLRAFALVVLSAHVCLLLVSSSERPLFSTY